jgi:NAD(P)-dependent dehydrogenase (short-subunit alcohol dehydrogenase family)
MDIRFDDKVAVITGAGRGLGRDYAMFLASRGAKVVVNDLGGAEDGKGYSEGPAQKVVDEIEAAGGTAVADFNSVAEPESARATVKTAMDRFGRVDILINNAGILRDKTFLKMSLADYEFVVKVHLLGTVYVTKAAFPVMRQNGYGRIVLATSTSGLYGTYGQTNYGAAKSGIVGFMQALKLEGEKYDIKVNTIAPLATSRLGMGIFPEEIMEMIKPGFVTAAVAFLCSAQCSASGDIICAGGGHYAKARMVESEGFRFNPNETVTPEMFAEKYTEITDMKGARGFDSGAEAVEKALAAQLELLKKSKSLS